MKQETSIRFGEFLVRIEYCANCSSHNGSLRHNEKKYLDKAQKLKDLLSKEFPFLTIVLQPLQLQISSKLGCFEVFYSDYLKQEEHLVSSKLRTLKWPEPKVVINNIRNFMKKKKLEVGLIVKNLERLAEKQRNLESVRCLLISEVDFPRVVQCLKTLQGRSKTLPGELSSVVGRPRVGSCYSGTTLKSSKPIRQIQSGMVNKKTPLHSRMVGTAPEFRNSQLNSSRPSRKSRNRVLSAIVIKKLESGETEADLIKHLLENKPCVFEEGVNRESKVIFPGIGPGRYRFIVLKDFNFKFGIKEIKVGPFIRPLDGSQTEEMEIETSDQAFFEMKVLQNKQNPIVSHGFQRVENEKKTFIEMEIVKKENAGAGSEYLYFKSNEVNPGKYEATFEFNNYSEKKIEVSVHCGLNKYTLGPKGLTESEPEGLPKFLDNETLTSQMKDLKVDDFFFRQEKKKRYNGEIPRIKRKMKKKTEPSKTVEVIQIKKTRPELQKREKKNKENMRILNTYKKKKKRTISKKVKAKNQKNLSGKKKKIKLSKKKKTKKRKNRMHSDETEPTDAEHMPSNEYRMKAVFAEEPSKERDFGKKLELSMQTIPENPSEVNSKNFRLDNISETNSPSKFNSIVRSEHNSIQNNPVETMEMINTKRNSTKISSSKKSTKKSSRKSKKKTNSHSSKKHKSNSKKKPKSIKNSFVSDNKGKVPSPMNSHFKSSGSSFHITPKNNMGFQASFNHEAARNPLTSRSINQQNSTLKKEDDKKARITSGNRIRPGERLPSAKSKASPSDTAQGKSRQTVPSFISSRIEEICFFEWFSEFESRVENGAINIFCSKSSSLDCSFILSETEPPRPIKSFNVCDGAFQQVLIPLSVDQPILCRLFFEIIKPQLDEEVLVVLYSCNNWLAFRLSDYIRSTSSFEKQDKFCDLALCNLSTGVMLPMLALTQNRPEVGTGIPEIRKLVSFVNNSKFGVSKFFGFDKEQVADTAREYILNTNEARDSLNSYEITGDLDYLLNSVRCDNSGGISLALIERMFHIWKELVKQTENFDFDDSFIEEEEFDELEDENEFDEMEDENEFEKDEFKDDAEFSNAFIKISEAG